MDMDEERHKNGKKIYMDVYEERHRDGKKEFENQGKTERVSGCGCVRKRDEPPTFSRRSPLRVSFCSTATTPACLPAAKFSAEKSPAPQKKAISCTAISYCSDIQHQREFLGSGPPSRLIARARAITAVSQYVFLSFSLTLSLSLFHSLFLSLSLLQNPFRWFILS